MTGSSCRRTKSQTGAERSAWRDTSESDRGKETPRYLMNIQKSDSPTDSKVFTEWDMQECNDFSVKISYGWVAALKENIALLQVIVRLLWLLWFELLKISIAWAALLTPHLCMFSPQALPVAPVTNMRCGCTLTKHVTRDCHVALIVLIWGSQWNVNINQRSGTVVCAQMEMKPNLPSLVLLWAMWAIWAFQ